MNERISNRYLSLQRKQNTAEADAEIKNRQIYLGSKGLVLLLALLSAFVPLSTDLYLPALPAMTRSFGVSVFEMNLTLILFFVFYAFTTLIWGPLSDKYGRRPILIIGMTGYTVASALCGVASSVTQLIAFRILQAAGGGAASALATAIVKDVYSGKKQESILAVVQSMVNVCPAIAPVIGAGLLKIMSWRGVFYAQAIFGVVAVAGSLALRETIMEKNSGASLMRMFGRLGVVLKNAPFTKMLLIFAAMNVPLMAFISSSSYIYQNGFGLDSQKYSYFFALNAAGLLIGPFLYVKLSSRLGRFFIINVSFALTILSGVLICAFGRLNPWIFAGAVLLGSMMNSCQRPPGVYLMLQQQKTDAGSASSLITAASIAMGSVGMVIASASSLNPVITIGGLNVLTGLLCGAAWLGVTRVRS